MEKKYILSELFTLIPAEYYSPQQGEAALRGQFALQGNHIFGRYDFEQANAVVARSEERRVGKECRSRWSPYH